jgi:ABC-type spermidine/putrescine transport system permease subunit I
MLLFPALAFLALFLVLPLGITLYTSFVASPVLAKPDGYFGPANYIYIAGTGIYIEIIFRTLRICAFVVIFTILLSYPTAFIFRRFARLGSGSAILILSFPMLAGPLVVVLGWMILLADGGPINNWLQWLGITSKPIEILRSETAIIISLVQFTLPFAVLNIFNALTQIPPHLIEAARSLGAPPLRRFLHVTLPLSLPGVLSAAIITFSLAISSFIAPAYLGGGTKLVLTTLISETMLGSYDLAMSSTIAVLLLIFSLAVVVAMNTALTRPGGGR